MHYRVQNTDILFTLSYVTCAVLLNILNRVVFYTYHFNKYNFTYTLLQQLFCIVFFFLVYPDVSLASGTNVLCFILSYLASTFYLFIYSRRKDYVFWDGKSEDRIYYYELWRKMVNAENWVIKNKKKNKVYTIEYLIMKSNKCSKLIQNDR